MTRQVSHGFRHSGITAAIFALLLQACAGHVSNRPIPGQIVFSETGLASFYAANYQNRKTASGERLNNNSMTAAHRTLPFGTQVIVKNINNGKSVKVRINDRGPFIKGRIIDLTRAAFSQIASLETGTVRVEISVME